MPSGTCSRRAGFADTIRLLASLIVLGCAIAGRTAENAFGKRGNRVANAISLGRALGPQRTLLDAVMAWQWSAPAFHDGMPGQPIWSLQWRAHSASRRPAPLRSESRWPRRWFVCFGSLRCSIGELQTSSRGSAAPCAQASSPRSSPVFSWFPLAAEDRMPPIAADQLTDAQKKAADAFVQGRGYAVRGPFVPLMRSPEVMLRAKAMGDYLRFKSTLGPCLNEMVILITAREWTQQYEWHAHYAIALKEGLRREIADAIADGRRPVGMAEDEDAAYDIATEILRTKRVSDVTYRRAVARFGEQGVIDLLGVIGYYNFLAVVMNATRTALPDNVAEPLKRYPE